MPVRSINRRTFVVESTLAAAAATGIRSINAAEPLESRQATGVRVGEVTDTTAIVWTRLTAHSARNNDGVIIPGRANGKKPNELAKITMPVEQLEGVCPGAAGRIRLSYGTNPDFTEAVTTEWVDVTEATDSIHQFALTKLKSGQRYYYTSETTGLNGKPVHGTFTGTFVTAPTPDTVEALRFCVMTCQGYPDRGHPDGHTIYPSMQALNPSFACLTGDLVYYDNDEPRAVTLRLARYHWERMFSLPRLREFTRNVSTYWLKDDHDTLNNDSWSGKSMGELTFAEGQKIFRQQAPLADGPSYRTFRWGRDLQIWFTDGRDFRSPNNMPDGPSKTIWGAEQKAWFKKTVAESNATWKVLVSPTPLVGPDRKGKNDNHANEGFQHEGDELRAWLKENVPDNFFVICGDRHWQYHSIHPQSGLHEFSVGAASNEHAGGTPGHDPKIHQFHRVKGGFLSVSVSRSEGQGKILFELRDVDGKVVYEWSKVRKE